MERKGGERGQRNGFTAVGWRLDCRTRACGIACVKLTGFRVCVAVLRLTDMGWTERKNDA